MGKENKNRAFIYIDDNDFETYQKLIKTHYFKGMKNIDLFLCATLIGINVVGKPSSLNNVNKKKDYIRIIDNRNKESLVILKALAISKFNDVNVLSDEDKLFSFCEDYANSGIKKLNEWYSSNEESFDNILTKELLAAWKTIDFKEIENIN